MPSRLPSSHPGSKLGRTLVMIAFGSNDSSVSCSPTQAYSVRTFFNSTACRPPTPLPCSSGAILLPSSPLELTPAGLPGSPCCSPPGLASPSLSRASLLLQEARLSVLLLLLPLLLLAVVLVSYPDNLSDKWLGVLWPALWPSLSDRCAARALAILGCEARYQGCEVGVDIEETELRLDRLELTLPLWLCEA